MNFDTVKFFYYPANIHITKPLGKVSLRYFIEAQKNPKQSIKDLFKEIRSTKDKKKLSGLKKQLYYFNPCVLTDGNGRCYSNIISFTGLMVMEFDKINRIEDFKQWVFYNLKSCVCAWISPSKKGVKFLIRIPIVKTIDEFKSYFYGIGHYFEKYKGWDGSAQNPILPLYLSYDPDFLYREDASVWKKKGIKEDEFKVYKGDIEPVKNVSESDRQRIINILSKSIDKIIDSGHPIVRSTALAGGGYVAAGYFSQTEMENMLFDLIDGNEYLQKDSKGYRRTAVDMIGRGMSAPLYLEKNVYLSFTPDNVQKIILGEKTSTVKGKSQYEKIGLNIGQSGFMKLNNIVFTITCKGLLTITEAGGVEKMLLKEGLETIDQCMFQQTKDWFLGKRKLYVYEIKKDV